MSIEQVLPAAAIAAAEGDGRSGLADFDAVVREHQPRIYRVLLAIVRDRDAAETLTQECFLSAYRHRESYRGEAQVGTWLMTIAVNQARQWMRNSQLKFWRKLTRHAEELRVAENVASTAATAEKVLIVEEHLRRVWDVVGELSAKQRMVFMLRFVEEMGLVEIAQVTGMQLGTVKSHLGRALATVRSHAGRNG